MLDRMDQKIYAVTYVEHNIPTRLPAKTVWGAWIRLKNESSKTWQLYQPEGKRVDLVVECDGQVSATHPMPRAEVGPGEQVTIHFPLRVPSVPGKHKLMVDLVEQNVTTFRAQGVKPLELNLYAEPGPVSRSTELYELAARISPWYYQPSRGIEQSRDAGGYPLFVSRAKGCNLWDLEGRQYIDYVMGWGCALLGYAEERVQKAMMAVMDSAAVIPFPHSLEIDVARMLTEDIPCAEMVVFGKNGSDVCTLAARVARVFTGKKTILCSGYHGWQDWWVEQAGFAASGVPDRPHPLIYQFKPNDLQGFMQLLEAHREDLAAVMLEPSGSAQGVQGHSQDADRDFLEALAQETRQSGALLIYDEIMTGFRYPDGGVQKATGVIPDLACLGKALSAGMPLSALVGKAHILQCAMGNTHYGPTFKGEVYSFAAARAALEIYRAEPVAEHVWSHGSRLRSGINSLCDEMDLAAECVGPPFRMVLVFDEADPERLNLKRTLYHQELLKSGLLTYNGFMLPSYAHDDEVMKTTLDAIGRALEKVDTAEKQDNFHSHLEIPLL